MKRTMNEYKNSMNKIVPSETFISETEALMRKLRDEQNGKIIEKKSDAMPEDIRKIDISSNSRTIRMKKWTIGISAAAAVLVCAVSLNVYNKANVDSSMTKDAETETSETTASAETTAPAVDEETVDRETTSANDEEIAEEIMAEMLSPDTPDEGSGEEENGSSADKKEQNDPERSADDAASDNNDKSNSDFGADPSEQNGINAANYVDENGEPVVYSDSDGSWDGTYDTQYSEWDRSDTDDHYEYDDTDSTEDPGYGSPVWVPTFIDESDDDTEDYDYDDDSGEEPDLYAVAGTAYDTPSVYALDVSFKSAVSGADEVYVPDAISDLEEGEYYITAEAGFDDVDESSGQLIASEGMTFPDSDTNSNSAIIAEICRLTEDKGQYHYDEETKMYDYRYKLTIYSSDKSENNAKLFEIIFNNGELVINRYDNGTVSSEKYIITEEEYAELDSFLRTLIQ